MEQVEEEEEEEESRTRCGAGARVEEFQEVCKAGSRRRVEDGIKGGWR